jgi:hypothetical protein
MSQQPAPQQPSGLKNPQILIAVIGAITTVTVTVLGVLPNIINSTRPTPTVAPIVITATPIPMMPSETPVILVIYPETSTPMEATSVPTTITLVADAATADTPTPLPVIQMPTTTTASASSINTQNTQPPNVRLIYDGVSISLLNESGGVLSLEGVRFRGGGREWEARNWGVQLHTSIPAGWCMRLRDAAAGQRQPPAPCQGRIYGLIEVGTVAFFWRDVASFEVVRNGVVIATCAAADGVGECGVYVGG